MDSPQIPSDFSASYLLEDVAPVRLVPSSSQPNTSLSLTVSAGSSQLGRWNESTWRADAACNGMDTLIFFPIGETGPALPQVNLARKICGSCPVKDECLEFAIATIQNDGIWGGTTEDERRLIKRARRAAARRAAKLSAA
jgi:WhiB family transcriptional regulator, redox-sensing transcriptional regulator